MVLPATHPTLLDVARMMDPDGKIAKIVEIPAQVDEVLADMVWQPGNLETGHRHTIMTGIPTPTWRKLYQGVQPTKGSRRQVTDTCGTMTALAEIDCKEADLTGDPDGVRAVEVRSQLLGMMNEFAQTLFYGNEGTANSEFTGLAPRYNSASAENGVNLIDGGGSGGGADCTSIWIVGWGQHSVFGVVPKHSKAGWKHENLGRVLSENIDGSNGRAMVYRDYFEWDCGLAVADWRYVVRIHSIDTINADPASGADLFDLVSQGISLLPDVTTVRPAIYANRRVITGFRRQAKAGTKNSTLMREDLGGRKVDTIDGIPLRRCDSITFTESEV